MTVSDRFSIDTIYVTIRPVKNVQKPGMVTVVRANFVGDEGDLDFWCDLLKFSLFHSPISVAPRTVKQSNSSSNVNMLVFSNTWGNMCKYI